jgi:molecular chaperone DnaK (HSP70)
MSRWVVGIDLGTTNSSVGFVRDGQPELVPVDGSHLLPSVVSLGPDGTVLVGQAARNQALLYPERTVRSVKRRMGQDCRLRLGDREYTPVEISAMILRRLKLAAEAYLKEPIGRAVITVPAYFSDAQRTATREAGEVAGFVVERVLHEPTAAALCYAQPDDRDRKKMVYDLGGGTFDVSVVRSRGEMTEVLASHGDTALGGDDFDAALLARLERLFESRHGVGLGGDPRALARLTRTAEETKIRLSTESYVRVIEEHLLEREGVGLHLDAEVTRPEYEELIQPFLDRTKDSVQRALREAGLLARDLDEVILVGGSTYTPRVQEMLQEILGIAPRRDVDPEKAVALGATLQAGRVAGAETRHILVDVTPFSFGASYFGILEGQPSPHCYKPIIRRNSPLPSRQTELFYTMNDGQRRVDARIFQGEDPDARRNLPLGRFLVDGLDPEAEAGSPVLYDLSLDLNGILQVEVTEKHTALKKRVVIEDAFRKLSGEELERARERILDAFGEGEDVPDEIAAPESPVAAPPDALPEEDRAAWTLARSLLEKAERMTPGLGAVDREEVLALSSRLRESLAMRDFARMKSATAELADVLFYLE